MLLKWLAWQLRTHLSSSFFRFIGIQRESFSSHQGCTHTTISLQLPSLFLCVCCHFDSWTRWKQVFHLCYNSEIGMAARQWENSLFAVCWTEDWTVQTILSKHKPRDWEGEKSTVRMEEMWSFSNTSLCSLSPRPDLCQEKMGVQTRCY